MKNKTKHRIHNLPKIKQVNAILNSTDKPTLSLDEVISLVLGTQTENLTIRGLDKETIAEYIYKMYDVIDTQAKHLDFNESFGEWQKAYHYLLGFSSFYCILLDLEHGYDI